MTVTLGLYFVFFLFLKKIVKKIKKWSIRILFSLGVVLVLYNIYWMSYTKLLIIFLVLIFSNAYFLASLFARFMSKSILTHLDLEVNAIKWITELPTPLASFVFYTFFTPHNRNMGYLASMVYKLCNFKRCFIFLPLVIVMLLFFLLLTLGLF